MKISRYQQFKILLASLEHTYKLYTLILGDI